MTATELQKAIADEPFTEKRALELTIQKYKDLPSHWQGPNKFDADHFPTSANCPLCCFYRQADDRSLEVAMGGEACRLRCPLKSCMEDSIYMNLINANNAGYLRIQCEKTIQRCQARLDKRSAKDNKEQQLLFGVPEIVATLLKVTQGWKSTNDRLYLIEQLLIALGATEWKVQRPEDFQLIYKGHETIYMKD